MNNRGFNKEKNVCVNSNLVEKPSIGYQINLYKEGGEGHRNRSNSPLAMERGEAITVSSDIGIWRRENRVVSGN